MSDPSKPSRPSGAPVPPPGNRELKKAKPTGLPSTESRPASQHENFLPGTRFCKKCKREGRVVSNDMGINVYCLCGNQWPISSMPLCPSMPESMPRGLRKETRVEPNWDLAFEDIGGGANEQIGPKKSG